MQHYNYVIRQHTSNCVFGFLVPDPDQSSDASHSREHATGKAMSLAKTQEILSVDRKSVYISHIGIGFWVVSSNL